MVMAAHPAPSLTAHRASPWALLRAWRSGAPWGSSLILMLVLTLAGCASGPRTGEVGRVKPLPERDGAPMTAPADLASLPDPVPQVEPIRPGGPNKPYVVLGQSYSPLQGDVSWSERGGASWYGHKFHGRRTASGELYSMYGLTAAHKTLPIPSYVRVRNVRNGKEIIVRVNDRGPFHPGRVVDLSYAAAVKLDIAAAGVGQVELSRLTFDEIRSGAWQRGTVLDPDPVHMATAPIPLGDSLTPIIPPPTATPTATPPADAGPTVPEAPASARAHTPAARGFWVQLAALGKRDGVDRLQQRIARELTGLLPLLAVFQEAPHFKLQAGPYASRQEAQAAARQVRDTLQLQPLVIERR